MNKFKLYVNNLEVALSNVHGKPQGNNLKRMREFHLELDRLIYKAAMYDGLVSIGVDNWEGFTEGRDRGFDLLKMDGVQVAENGQVETDPHKTNWSIK